jgi:hypothetical protein
MTYYAAEIHRRDASRLTRIVSRLSRVVSRVNTESLHPFVRDLGFVRNESDHTPPRLSPRIVRRSRSESHA